MKPIEIPDNKINAEGINQVKRLLEKYGMNPERIDDIKPFWATKKGTYPKRISKRLHSIGYKVPPALLSKIGTIVKEHCIQVEKFYYDITDNFDWRGGDFGDSRSCFFSGDDTVLEDLYINDFLAFRVYNERKSGIARSWILEKPEYTIMFNGYGLSTLQQARMYAYIEGLSYKKVSLSGDMYINSDIGYIIGKQENLRRVFTEELYYTKGRCYFCGDRASTTIYNHGSAYVCDNCIAAGRVSACDRCHNLFRWIYSDANGVAVCEDCRGFYLYCATCRTYKKLDYKVTVYERVTNMCKDCLCAPKSIIEGRQDANV